MSPSPELDRLADRWAEEPTSTCFAPLAEGLRKRGMLDEAASVALRGVASRPDYLPGHLVLARIYRDQRLWDAADTSLRAALAIDAEHPVALDALDQLAVRRGVSSGAPDEGDGEPTDLVYSDEASVDALTPGHELVVTESLAMLYWGQGHHQQAIAAFDTLIQRNPGNADLVARRAMVRAEFEAARPTPFDSAERGRLSVRDWLAALAAVTTRRSPTVSGFDAFYQAPANPSSAEPSDLAAFQAWLQELDR